jgi:hypothetical protein
MTIYQILPTDKSSPSPGIVARGAAHVLGIVARLACKEADVLRDGKYCGTLRLGGNGIWLIFERDNHGEAVPSIIQLVPRSLSSSASFPVLSAWRC